MLSTELIKKLRRIEIRTRRLVNDSFAGEYHAIFKGRGMEFSEVRPYIAGDEVRSIDWNVTARMGQPYIKRFVEERELTVLLVVDASASNDFGSQRYFKRELSAEVAAALSFCATTNNDKVGLLIFSDRIECYVPPRKGRRHVLRLIRDLLAFRPLGKGTDVALSLDTINCILKRRSIIFLISDFQADVHTFQSALARTNRRHDLVALDLSDSLESDIPNVGILTLEDAETQKYVLVDTGDRRWQNAFSQKARQHELMKQQTFFTAGVDQVHIRTDEDYVDALAAFFNKRARRLRK